MRKIGLAALVACLPVLAHADQAKTVVGGVDSRVPSIANQYLAQQIADKAQQAAQAAAMLTVEKQDRKELEDEAQAKVEQARKEADYWRAYAGFGPQGK